MFQFVVPSNGLELLVGSIRPFLVLCLLGSGPWRSGFGDVWQVQSPDGKIYMTCVTMRGPGLSFDHLERIRGRPGWAPGSGALHSWTCGRSRAVVVTSSTGRTRCLRACRLVLKVISSAGVPLHVQPRTLVPVSGAASVGASRPWSPKTLQLAVPRCGSIAVWPGSASPDQRLAAVGAVLSPRSISGGRAVGSSAAVRSGGWVIVLTVFGTGLQGGPPAGGHL